MRSNKLRVVLVESPLELVLEDVREHSQVVHYARRFEVDPSEILLNKTYHYYAMAELEKR